MKNNFSRLTVLPAHAHPFAATDTHLTRANFSTRKVVHTERGKKLVPRFVHKSQESFWEVAARQRGQSSHEYSAVLGNKGQLLSSSHRSEYLNARGK